MEKFAKLYEHEGIGQILVMKTSNDEGRPSLKVIISVEGDEVAAGPGYADTDEGWDALDDAFDKVDETWAVEFAKQLFLVGGGV
jgi:hypothetical protein